MFKLALKGIMARKGRLLLTSLAVILGTSFLAGTYIFSDTLTKSFDDLFADVFEDTDAYVRSTVVIEGDFGAEERQRIPESLTAHRRRGSGREDRCAQRARASPGSSARTASPSAPKAMALRTSARRSSVRPRARPSGGSPTDELPTGRRRGRPRLEHRRQG